MQLHQLKPKHKSKEKKRIGRGGKRGTYSGRGIKGQKSRAGRKFAPVIRGLIKKYPKLRGYRTNAPEKNITVVNLEVLEQEFNNSEIVSPKILLEKKIISKIKGRMPKVKILARGEIKKSLMIQGCDLSESAKTKIEKAKGKVKEIIKKKRQTKVVDKKETKTDKKETKTDKKETKTDKKETKTDKKETKTD